MGAGSAAVAVLHAVLAVFLIIELGLTGYVVGQTNIGWWDSSPSSFNFMLFNAIWSILVLIYLVVSRHFVESVYHPIVHLILLVITAIFWFAGSIAMAAFIGVPSCPVGFDFCHVLRTSQAAVAFGFFIWVIFCVLTGFEAMGHLRGGGARVDSTKPAAPATAQPSPYAGA